MSSSPSTNSHTKPTLARTPLFDLVVEQQARLTEFSGWEMPVQFAGLKQEHQAVRTAVGMFDISHMGKFFLKGKQLLKDLQFLVPSDLERLQPGKAQYTVLLNPEAGIIDDFIFYYQGEDEDGQQRGVAIVNAATLAKDRAWLLQKLQDLPVALEDLSQEQVLMALQGPKVVVSLQRLVEEDFTSLKAFEHAQVKIFGQPAFISRTGYTGEDGFEIMLNPEPGKKLWRSLLDAGVAPCGLGARDTLRLEAAMPLYGHEIDETTTPLEAGLAWLVHLDSKGDFLGRSVLEQQKAAGVERRLVGLQMEGRHIARHGYPIHSESEPVGEITSGTLAPTVGRAIALGYVPKPLAQPGQQLQVEIRGKAYPAVVVKKPFYRSQNRPPK